MKRLARILLPVLAILGGIGMAQAEPVAKIIGGKDALNGAWPFMAALVRPLTAAPSDTDFDTQFCGGTVIATRWVLTAAHCISNNNSVININEVEVITGVTTLSTTPADNAPRLAVSAILRHPAYNASSLRADVALLYLAEATAADSTFAINDGSLLDSMELGDPLTAIGWGATTQDNPATPNDETSYPPTLQEVVLDYFPYTICNGPDYYDGALNADALCAGFLLTPPPPRDTCRGDSGGPLLHALGGGAWRQVGITSYGATSQCAQAGEPAIYANVGMYSSYINGVTQQADLKISARDVPNAPTTGNQFFVRLTISNLSPANTAIDATLTMTLADNMTITGIDPLTDCTNNGTSCNLGSIAPGISLIRDVTMSRRGTGTFTINATVDTPTGDYDNINNQVSRSYTVTSSSSGGGSASFMLIVMLALLTGRRRTMR